ncbi:MAG TPA: hypothetical protein VN732_03800 [Solirubrobacterales bacterium]|nr:hypothetical protein [Solirubrobacterales bacterium]
MSPVAARILSGRSRQRAAAATSLVVASYESIQVELGITLFQLPVKVPVVPQRKLPPVRGIVAETSSVPEPPVA